MLANTNGLPKFNNEKKKLSLVILSSVSYCKICKVLKRNHQAIISQSSKKKQDPGSQPQQHCEDQMVQTDLISFCTGAASQGDKGSNICNPLDFKLV